MQQALKLDLSKLLLGTNRAEKNAAVFRRDSKLRPRHLVLALFL